MKKLIGFPLLILLIPQVLVFGYMGVVRLVTGPLSPDLQAAFVVVGGIVLLACMIWVGYAIVGTSYGHGLLHDYQEEQKRLQEDRERAQKAFDEEVGIPRANIPTGTRKTDRFRR
jgi:hypothetical protein